MATYEYGISDFAGVVNHKELTHEIKNNVDIGGLNFNHLSISGEYVRFAFVISITKNILDSIVANHSSSGNPTLYENQNISINRKIKNTTYRLVHKIHHKGNGVARFSIIGNMDTGVTSYHIRIYDSTHNNTIIESTFTNLTSGMHEMGDGTNISSNESVLEIHIKKTGGTNTQYCYLENIFMEF
jgi:hypothetical protein